MPTADDGLLQQPGLLPEAGSSSGIRAQSQISVRADVCANRYCRAIRAGVLVLVAAVAEIVISILAQNTTTGANRYDAPFLMIYINHSATGLSCLLVGMSVLRLKGKTFQQIYLDAGFRSYRATVFTATCLGILFFCFNVFWVISVSLTTVSIFTTISKSYCVFVFALSVCMLGERVTAGKCLAVVLCVAGLAMTSVGGEKNVNSHTHLEGVLTSLAFALGNALFNVLWGCYFDNASIPVILVFLGLIGSSGIIACLPVLPILAASHVQPLVVPTFHQAMAVAIVALASVFNNFTLLAAVSFTSPLIMAIGQVLEIPLSAALDALLHGEVPTSLAAIGMALVIGGFLLMLVEQSKQK